MPVVKTQEGYFYEHSFVTTFEETNVVGNIYFANFVVWQGKCREMFMHEYCRDVIEEINEGLKLITLDVSCQYIDQLYAFDEVVMHMNVEVAGAHRMMMNFKYYAQKDGERRLVCIGSQGAAAMKIIDGKLCQVSFPESMLDAIESHQLVVAE